MTGCCIGYLVDGNVCDRPATHLDEGTGGLLCDDCWRAKHKRQALLEWAARQDVTVTCTPAEMSRQYELLAQDCEPTHSGHLRGRDEGRIIASLRHNCTNYESCLHLLSEQLLGMEIDADTWEAEEAQDHSADCKRCST